MAQGGKYNPVPMDEEGLVSQDEQVVYSSTGTTTHIRWRASLGQVVPPALALP